MINDRFNSEKKFDLKEKLRDKKFVSAAAIGIFVLILLIVLFAKGCSKSKPGPKTKPAQTQGQLAPQMQPEAPAVGGVGGGDGSEQYEEDEGAKLMADGRDYMNGEGGKAQSYPEAIKCFSKAEKLGVKGAKALKELCIKKNRKR